MDRQQTKVLCRFCKTTGMYYGIVIPGICAHCTKDTVPHTHSGCVLSWQSGFPLYIRSFGPFKDDECTKNGSDMQKVIVVALNPKIFIHSLLEHLHKNSEASASLQSCQLWVQTGELIFYWYRENVNLQTGFPF